MRTVMNLHFQRPEVDTLILSKNVLIYDYLVSSYLFYINKKLIITIQLY